MSQQDVSSVPTEQWSSPAQPTSDRTLRNLRSGIFLIAWFIIFDTIYSLTRSVISMLDTNYNVEDSARLFIGVVVATVVAFLIVTMAQGGQD